MTVITDKAQWIEAQQALFKERTGAGLAFLPELKRAFLDLTEHEPFHGRVKVNVAEEDPYLLTVSAGLFELKLAVDVLSDTVFYAFVSATLKRMVPMESAIFHYGQMKVARGYWGIIDGPDEEVDHVFVDDPQSVQYLSLADQVARWGVEQLIGGYASIAGLEQAASEAAELREEAAKKDAKKGAKRDSNSSDNGGSE